jgi:ribose transport system ATP-binding protein
MVRGDGRVSGVGGAGIPSSATAGSQAGSGVLEAVPTLRIRGLVKRFPGVLALGGVDFDAYPGEVHALLGANGAGKSTLIKILAQLYSHDEGTIEINGQPLGHTSRTAAPITFIHQDLGLIDEITVAENFAVIGGYARRAGLIDHRATRDRARTALAAIGADIDPAEVTGELSRADKSLVAIARALSQPSDLLFLDEPTASLHRTETERLFDAVRLLRSQGTAIVYVTHRLDEVFRLADRVTVLRDGERVLSAETSQTDGGRLVGAITGGRELASRAPSCAQDSVALSARDLRVGSGASASFDLHRGEIVGAAGLQGAGQVAIGRALCGIEPIVGGELLLDGQPVALASSASAISRGIVFVTSSRESEGLAYDMSCLENLYLNPGARGIGPFALRSRKREQAQALEVMQRFGVTPPDPTRLIANLSGGNQQKVILARCLALDSTVVVLEEPTMGVDVGGRADIFALLREAAADGKATLVVSTDFEELATLCDRVIVFDRGTVIDELRGDRIGVSTLTQVASGGSHV